MTRPAVVFGLLHAGLALARTFGRAGISVGGVALSEREFGLRSRYLASRVLALSDDEVLGALRGNPVLFPERDENVELVLRRWDDVRALADVPLPDDPDAVLRLRRKDRLPLEATKAGVPAPATVLASSEQAIRDADLRPPFLVKPAEGQDFALAFGHKAVVAETVDEAVGAWRRAHAHGFETIVQELIPESHERVYSLFTYVGRDGAPLASVVGRKVRQGPLRFGTSAIFEVRYDPRVHGLGLALLASAGYRGFAHVEFAHDDRDDAFKLLEVNTRPPIWAGIAMGKRFDIARAAYDDLSGRPHAGEHVFRDEVSWVYLAKDVWVSWQMARRRELRLRDFASHYVRPNKVRAVFAVDDPWPAVASLGYLRSRVR